MCVNCSGSRTNCTSCKSSYFIQETRPDQKKVGVCNKTCPADHWADNSTWECKKCFQGSGDTYSSCKTCNGPTIKDCLSCSPKSFLYPKGGGHCLSQCPAGLWEDISNSMYMPLRARVFQCCSHRHLW